MASMNTTAYQARPASAVHRAPGRFLTGLPHTSKHSNFLSGNRTIHCNVTSGISVSPGRHSVQVVAFKFMKQLGLKKPAFLPDFGQKKRQALLMQLFSTLDRSTLEGILAVGASVQEGDEGRQKMGREEFISLLADHVAPAIPDYSWGAATDGSKDEAGWSLVTVQATGQHTGKPFSLPGMDPVEATGKRFKLAEERVKVKVEDGKVQEVLVLPVKGAGPLALYQALGGKVPAHMNH